MDDNQAAGTWSPSRKDEYILARIGASSSVNDFKSTGHAHYPLCMNGTKLEAPMESAIEYNVICDVTTFFWMTPVIQYPLPIKPELRRSILYDHFDLHHLKICSSKCHHSPSIACECRFCGYSAERYHFRRCPAVMFKTPSGRLKFLNSHPHD